MVIGRQWVRKHLGQRRRGSMSKRKEEEGKRKELPEGDDW